MNWRIAVGTAVTYIGAVVGAGFVSGQEIWQFFARYGVSGLVGASLVGVLFAWFGGSLTGQAVRHDWASYSSVYEQVCGKWAPVFDAITTIFGWIGTGVMLSGAGAVLATYWHLSPWIGVPAAALVVIVCLLFDVDGLLTVNVALVAFLMLVIVAVAFLVKPRVPLAGVRLSTGIWTILTGMLYFSYNALYSVTVLTGVTNSAGKREQRSLTTGAAIGGSVLGALVILLTILLVANNETAAGTEVPLAHVVGKLGTHWGPAYALALLCALVSTALGTAFGLANRLAPSRRPLAAAVVTVSAVPVGMLPFSSLVAFAYPLLGVAGTIFLAIYAYWAYT